MLDVQGTEELMHSRLQDRPVEVDLNRSTLGRVEPFLMGNEEGDHARGAANDLVPVTRPVEMDQRLEHDGSLN